MKMNNHWVFTDSFSPVDGVEHGESLEMVVAVCLQDRGACPDVDVGGRLDLRDEIRRHRLAERTTPDEKGDRAASLGKVDGGLPGRVGAADDVNVLPGTADRFGQGGSVVHPPAGERCGAWSIQLAVGDASSQDRAVCFDGAAVGEAYDACRAANFDGG